MIRDLIEKQIEALLPLYANGRISPVGRRLVEAWLKRSPAAQDRTAQLERLRGSLAEDLVEAAPGRWPILDTQSVQPEPAPARTWQMGLALALLLFVFSWVALPPAVELAWSVEGSAPAVFRVYRAPVSEQDGFVLVEEIPAGQVDTAYHFRDLQLVPGQELVYRIEAVSQDGQSLADETIVGDAALLLPGQLALLLALAVAVYGLAAYVNTRKTAPPMPFLPSL